MTNSGYFKRTLNYFGDFKFFIYNKNNELIEEATVDEKDENGFRQCLEKLKYFNKD